MQSSQCYNKFYMWRSVPRKEKLPSANQEGPDCIIFSLSNYLREFAGSNLQTGSRLLASLLKVHPTEWAHWVCHHCIRDKSINSPSSPGRQERMSRNVDGLVSCIMDRPIRKWRSSFGLGQESVADWNREGWLHRETMHKVRLMMLKKEVMEEKKNHFYAWKKRGINLENRKRLMQMNNFSFFSVLDRKRFCTVKRVLLFQNR